MGLVAVMDHNRNSSVEGIVRDDVVNVCCREHDGSCRPVLRDWVLRKLEDVGVLCQSKHSIIAGFLVDEESKVLNV